MLKSRAPFCGERDIESQLRIPTRHVFSAESLMLSTSILRFMFYVLCFKSYVFKPNSFSVEILNLKKS